MLDYLNKLDTNAILAVNALSGDPVLDFIMTTLSSAWVWTTLGILVFIFLGVKKQTAGIGLLLAALIALCLADLVSFEVVKQLVGRERPCWTVEGIRWVLGQCGGSYGFTSNHAANAAAVVTTLCLSPLVSARIKYMAVICAFFIGLSRVYLGVHFPGDILGGYVLGATIAGVLWWTPLLKVTTIVARRIVARF